MIVRLTKLLKKILLLIAVYGIMFLLVFFSKELSSGIKNGINVSLNLVIPSLFIFIIFSNIVINTSLQDSISKPFKFIAKYIFKINESYIAIVILSLIGGYPIGAKLLASAVKKNQMSKKTAEKMLCYSVNCGPAFLISGVGVAIFNNLKAGLLLYLSQIIACLSVGFIISFSNKKTIDHISMKPQTIKKSSFSMVIVNAVNDAVKAMTVICGFIVAFSAFMPAISVFTANLKPQIKLIINGILEVTTGCNNLNEAYITNPLILAAIFTSFGGICVFMQIAAMVKSADIRLYYFFITRPIYTIISVLTLKVFLLFSPDIANCFSINKTISKEIYSVSPAATAFLLLLSVMLLFFTRKSVNIKDI